MKMLTRAVDSKGVSLIECLIGILLVSIALTGIMGVYYLSPYTINRGKHTAMANSILQSYMEQEIAAGYDGGENNSWYATMALSTGGSMPVTIDDRGTTADTSDDLMGTLSCSPWSPVNYQYQSAPWGDLQFDGVRYKIVGFIVSWVEKAPLAGQGQTCSVRTASYVCEHK